ncbi:hypothetical protein P9112_002253 [Eukaryota sp. TZLM1-RC]
MFSPVRTRSRSSRTAPATPITSLPDDPVIIDTSPSPKEKSSDVEFIDNDIPTPSIVKSPPPKPRRANTAKTSSAPPKKRGRKPKKKELCSEEDPPPNDRSLDLRQLDQSGKQYNKNKRNTCQYSLSSLLDDEPLINLTKDQPSGPLVIDSSCRLVRPSNPSDLIHRISCSLSLLKSICDSHNSLQITSVLIKLTCLDPQLVTQFSPLVERFLTDQSSEDDLIEELKKLEGLFFLETKVPSIDEGPFVGLFG